MEKQPIRILNIVPNMRSAGIENFIMNVYRNIDRSKVQFDFIVHNQERKVFDDEIEKLGGRIYRFTYKDDKKLLKYIKDLDNFFKEHKEYKIVHGHMQSMMPLYLYIAKKNCVPIRIAHSHNGNYEKTLKGFILHIFSRFAKYQSNVNLACSNIAGKYLFGNKKFKVIPNAIDIKKFTFNEHIRESMRKELGIENNFVVGHIGRFELQKNHKYIIDIFNEVLKENKKAVLLLIGEGKLEENIKSKVKKLQIEKNIKFLGVRNDVNKIYQAMDCFILPSLYEGLPGVGIEAQISGLYSIFSKNITSEVKISENSCFLRIRKKDIDEWKTQILKKKRREKNIDVYKYDIKNISKLIERMYLNYEKD